MVIIWLNRLEMVCSDKHNHANQRICKPVPLFLLLLYFFFIILKPKWMCICRLQVVTERVYLVIFKCKIYLSSFRNTVWCLLYVQCVYYHSYCWFTNNTQLPNNRSYLGCYELPSSLTYIYTHTYIYYIFARMYIIKRLYVYSCSCSCNRRSCAKSRSGLLPDYACVKSPCLCVNQI